MLMNILMKIASFNELTLIPCAPLKRKLATNVSNGRKRTFRSLMKKKNFETKALCEWSCNSVNETPSKNCRLGIGHWTLMMT